MPRTIDVVLPPDKTDDVVGRLSNVDGVVGLALQRDSSLNPPGDVLTVQTTNEGARQVLNYLTEVNVLEGGSVATGALKSLMSSPYQDSIDVESNEAIWEEMASLLRQDTNTSVNYLLTMMLAGCIAAIGLWTNTLHLVIGAMVIAPGFEPLTRIVFGQVADIRPLSSRGVLSVASGYLALMLGAAVVYYVMHLIDPSASTDLTSRSWVRYWSTLNPSDALLALLAGSAGAVVIVAQRSVLTAGVMIALALIPSMAIVGMAIAGGDFELALRGLLRWLVDVGAVILASALVLGLKQAFLHRRKALG